MLGGVLEAYFQWFYEVLLRMFRFNPVEHAKQHPGIKHSLVRLSFHLLADLFGVLALLILVFLVLFLVFVVRYYL